MLGVARLMIEGVAAGGKGVSASRPLIMNPAPCRSVLHLGDLLTLLTLKQGTVKKFFVHFCCLFMKFVLII